MGTDFSVLLQSVNSTIKHHLSLSKTRKLYWNGHVLKFHTIKKEQNISLPFIRSDRNVGKLNESDPCRK